MARVIAVVLLGVGVASGVAVAQVPVGGAMSQGPGMPVARTVSEVGIGQIHLDELTQATVAIAKLRTDVRALQARLAASEGEAQATRAQLAGLESAYRSHHHRVVGLTGAGLSTTSNGDGVTIRYLIPYKTDAQIEAGRDTGGPLP